MTHMTLNKLSQQLSQQFIEQLPGITEDSHSPRQTPGVCWSHCTPTAVASPEIRAYFSEVADDLGIDAADMQTPEMAQWLGGNQTLQGATPYSACYGGHQFGHWAGQLGDGRAITIAEIVNNNQRFDLQLKGAGLTPYSRTADGRAVLRSSIREFLCSEAMHHLGIPTTRALSLVTTGEQVVRDVMYDGHAAPEPGAIVCRVAPSFLRFGSFEIFAARQESDVLNQLIDFCIKRDFPKIESMNNKSREQKIALWFSEVCKSTAKMVIDWQRVGFVHGVMNTDNLSILGLTIDYGPYGWLDNFDSNWTPNTTDAQGKRYRFGNQPAICRWNLICLANALATVIDDLDIFKMGIALFDNELNDGMLAMQCNKFGLDNCAENAEQNAEVINAIYPIMQQSEMDYTLFFTRLTELDVDVDIDVNNLCTAQLDDVFYDESLKINFEQEFKDWLKNYAKLVKQQGLPADQRQGTMKQANPQFILRNYLSQQAIDKAEKGDFSEVDKLMELLRTPYDISKDDADYLSKRPDWAKHKVGCSMLSCSS